MVKGVEYNETLDLISQCDKYGRCQFFDSSNKLICETDEWGNVEHFLDKENMSAFGLQKVAIMGSDDRRCVTQAEEKVFENIGLLDLADFSGSVNTAMVTGKNCDYVLTAAHVLYDRQLRRRLYKNYIYTKAYNDREKRMPISLVTDGWQEGARYGNTDYDYSLFKSPTRLVEQCNQFEFRASEKKCRESEKTTVVAFHSDTLACKSIDKTSCTTSDWAWDNGGKKLSPNAFSFSCDTKGSSSGAPVICLNELGNTYAVIGLNTGYFSGYSRNVVQPKRAGAVGPAEFWPADPNRDRRAYYNLGPTIWGELKELLELINK